MLSRALAVTRTGSRVVTSTGRGVLLLGLVAFAGSLAWGLVELRLVAVMCLGVLLAAVPWLLVPMRVEADLRLRPPRTTAGEAVEASLTATNNGALPLWQPLVRMPVGARETWVRMPSLDRGSRERVEVVVDDLARGVLQVGPATAVRSDPLGLLHRPVRWGGARELFVRPAMVVVPTLGAGQVRDLEGTPSDRVSMSDLAFHALREYVPGRRPAARPLALLGPRRRAAGPAVPRHPTQPRHRRGRRRPARRTPPSRPSSSRRPSPRRC